MKLSKLIPFSCYDTDDEWGTNHRLFVPKVIAYVSEGKMPDEWDQTIFKEYLCDYRGNSVASIQQGGFPLEVQKQIRKNWGGEIKDILQKIALNPDTYLWDEYSRLDAIIKQYSERHYDAAIRIKINKAIDSSPDLRDKKELIEAFIKQLTPDSDVDAAWRQYVNAEKRRQFETIVNEENLKRKQAIEFIENAYERGYVPEGGIELDSIMPPINPFDANANREGKIATVLEKLKAFFKRFSDISDGVFND